MGRIVKMEADPKSENQAGFAILSAAIACAIIGAALYAHDTVRLDWQHAARWTADFSALLFLSIFVPQLRRILPHVDRRQRVLGFVTAHIIHAGAFIAYHLASSAPEIVTIALGGLGYALIAVMALIPPPAAPRLHRIGIWYIWFIFIATFAGGLGDTERYLPALIGVIAFLAAAIARLAKHVRPGIMP
jgi:methionine sulfoxide reductase heme-binding subunit